MNPFQEQYLRNQKVLRENQARHTTSNLIQHSTTKLINLASRYVQQGQAHTAQQGVYLACKNHGYAFAKEIEDHLHRMGAGDDVKVFCTPGKI